MATAQQIFRILQRGGNPWTDQDEISSEDIEAEIGEQKPSLGLLGTIGKVLDFPGMALRSGITALAGKGKWGASGRDVLSALWLAKEKPPEGFDWGSLGTEMVLDPLNLLGGLGVLTKGGRAASALSRGRKALTARRLAQEEAFSALSRAGLTGDKAAIELADKAFGAAVKAKKLAREDALRQVGILRETKTPPFLKPTWAEQAKAGQRQVLGWDIPFTGIKGKIGLPEGLESRVLGALEPAGKAVMASRPMAWLTSKFKYNPEALEKTAPLYQIHEEAQRAALGAGHRAFGELEGDIGKIAAQYGQPMEEIQRRIYRGVEKYGKGDRGTEGLRAFFPEGRPTGLPELEDTLHAYRPEERAIIERLIGQQKHLLGAAQGAGIPVTALGDESLEYMHRTLTPEARKANLETLGEAGPIYRRLREFNPKAGFAQARVKELEGMTVDEANKFLHDLGGVEKTFWESPAVSHGVYRTQVGQKVATAQLAKGLVKQFSRPAGEGVQGLTVKEFLEKAPLSIEGMAEHELARVVPDDVAGEFLRLNEKMAQPDKYGAVMKSMEGIRRWMSAWLLAPFPAYHVRNLTSNGIMTWMAGVFSPKNYARAIKQWNDPEMRKFYEELGVLHGGITREFGTGAAQRWLEEVTQKGKPGLIEKLKHAETTPGVGGVVRVGFGTGEYVEGVSRIAHYLGARESGMSALDAVNDVKKWLFNANELGSADKAIRPLAFFYSWYRKALPRLVKSFQETPSRMAMLSRMVTQPTVEREALPDWLRTGTAIPMGKDQQGQAQYIGGLGTPLEAFNTIDFLPMVKSGLLGIPQAILQKALTQATPPIKAAAELATGTNLATGAPIAESTKAYPSPLHKIIPGYQERELPGGRKTATADPWALWAIRQTPISRLLSEAGRLSDPGRSTATALANVLTGLRTHSVDIEGEKLARQRGALEEMLETATRAGKAKPFKEWFATGKPGEKDEAVLRLLKLKRAVRAAQAAH